eukprot:3213149-Prymnesium_polylepis.1
MPERANFSARSRRTGSPTLSAAIVSATRCLYSWSESYSGDAASVPHASGSVVPVTCTASARAATPPPPTNEKRSRTKRVRDTQTHAMRMSSKLPRAQRGRGPSTAGHFWRPRAAAGPQTFTVSGEPDRHGAARPTHQHGDGGSSRTVRLQHTAYPARGIAELLGVIVLGLVPLALPPRPRVGGTLAQGVELLGGPPALQHVVHLRRALERLDHQPVDRQYGLAARGAARRDAQPPVDVECDRHARSRRDLALEGGVQLERERAVRREGRARHVRRDAAHE